MKYKVGMISLGCDKNKVESEYMLALLDKQFEIVNDPEEADVVIINTCSFIQPAVKESIDTILAASAYQAKIIVTGCLNMRYKNIAKDDLLPEVSAFVDNQHYASICDIVYNVLEGGKKTLVNKGVATPMSGERVLTTPSHYASLRIADGCDNNCSYCAIPKIRGGYRAVPPPNIVDEVKRLTDDYGTKEFILVAQDVSRYLYQDVDLFKLLDMIEDAGARKIRLTYCYPEAITQDLIDRFKQDAKLLPYVDLPLQHVDDEILAAMNRKSRYDEIITLLQKLKKNKVTVRSTFISGFPGESEQAHQKLLSFIKKGYIDYAGFFPYYREEGTKAYGFAGQLSQKVKKLRVSELLDAQTKVCLSNNQKLVGKKLKVTFDYIDYDKNRFVGHTDRQHPENDTHVFFTSKTPVVEGEEYDVLIKSLAKLDLKGEKV